MKNIADNQNRPERSKKLQLSLVSEVAGLLISQADEAFANLHEASWRTDPTTTLEAMNQGRTTTVVSEAPQAITPPEQVAKVMSINRASQDAQDAARSISEYQDDVKSAA